MTAKTVIGYASLLSKASILRLFPEARNIQPVRIENHARCFNSYGSLSVKAGLAPPQSRFLSHASAIVRPGSALLALAFDLNDTDYQTYERHEFRYCLKSVQVTPLKPGNPFTAILCYENVDHQIDAGLVGKASILELYKEYGVNSFWHTGHLPATHYFEHCLAAAYALGTDFFDNFLDQSFLDDRQTRIRTFIEQHGKDPVSYAETAGLSDIF